MWNQDPKWPSWDLAGRAKAPSCDCSIVYRIHNKGRPQQKCGGRFFPVVWKNISHRIHVWYIYCRTWEPVIFIALNVRPPSIHIWLVVIAVHPQLLCFWGILLKGHWKAPPELQSNWTDPKPSCQMLRTLCARQLALQLRLSLLMCWLVWRRTGQCWSSSCCKQLQNRSRMRPASSRHDERRSRSNMQRWNCIVSSVYEWFGLKAFHMRMSFFPLVRWRSGAGWWKRPVLWPSRIWPGFWAAKVPLLTERRQVGVKDSPNRCLFLTRSCSRLGCIVELWGNRCV